MLSANNQYLFAANAGSNDISVFAVQAGGLRLLDRMASGGVRPTSLTVAGDLLYVLNAGGTGNITGFTGARQGRLLHWPARPSRSAVRRRTRPRCSSPRTAACWS
ncbi:MAG: beta-propeller fold lactonase family protein [Dehalococcoidia bacterium]